MNKLVATLLIVAVVVNTASAFTAQPAPSLATRTRQQQNARLGPSFDIGTSSSTALNLKVKVDPNAKGNKNVAGNAKMAAYGGSVAFAVLLPIAFLIWSAVSK